MLLNILPLELWIKILEYMDVSPKFTIKDILNLATCEKYLMNSLIESNQIFHKNTRCPIDKIKSPFFVYSIINLYTKNIIECKKIYYDAKDNSKFNMIPQNTKEIIFSRIFNDCIKNLPNSITHLKIQNYSFDKNIEVLPYNLKLIAVCSLNKLKEESSEKAINNIKCFKSLKQEWIIYNMCGNIITNSDWRNLKYKN